MLTNNMQSGISSFNEDNLDLLKQKHQKNKQAFKKPAISTKGESIPSGMDADGWIEIK